MAKVKEKDYEKYIEKLTEMLLKQQQTINDLLEAMKEMQKK